MLVVHECLTLSQESEWYRGISLVSVRDESFCLSSGLGTRRDAPLLDQQKDYETI